MKNNNDTNSGDLEEGMAVGRKETTPSLSPPKKTSASACIAATAEESTEHVSSLSRILQCLTRTSTKQMALLLLCVAAAILDPLFFYIPMIDEKEKCMKSDRKLGVIAISLRSLVDVLHFVLWSFYYGNKWKASTSGVSASAAAAAPSKEISPGNSNSLSPRNSKATGLLIEILCILPLPQAATLAILVIKGSPRSQQAVTVLKFSVLSQVVLHAVRVFPSFNEATKNSFTLLKIRFWSGAALNLLLFVIASHVLGAFWYLLSVGRTMDCWKSACRNRVGCNVDSLYCGGPMDNKSYLDVYCPIQEVTNSSAFDFGIYLSALQSNIVGSTRVQLKLSYGFWWGLRNLSSLGQNLATSAYEWEICFSICISILGLILFSLFIGNMQAYFQYQTNEDLKNMKRKMDKIMKNEDLENMKRKMDKIMKNEDLENMKRKMDKIVKKQRDLSNWQPFQWLPPNIKEDVILCLEDNWLETTEVDLSTTLNYLPQDLGLKIKKKIFTKVKNRVKLFQTLNWRALNSTFDLVKPEVFARGYLVFRKGQPIDKIVVIVNGNLKKQTGNHGSTDEKLKQWDFCGEELLKEIVNGSSTAQSSNNRPPSNADIKTCSKVEAFVLDEDDLQNWVNNLPKDTINKIKLFFEAPKTPRAAGMHKQKKKAAEKPTGMSRSASGKETRTSGGTP